MECIENIQGKNTQDEPTEKMAAVLVFMCVSQSSAKAFGKTSLDFQGTYARITKDQTSFIEHTVFLIPKALDVYAHSQEVNKDVFYATNEDSEINGDGS